MLELELEEEDELDVELELEVELELDDELELEDGSPPQLARLNASNNRLPRSIFCFLNK